METPEDASCNFSDNSAMRMTRPAGVTSELEVKLNAGLRTNPSVQQITVVRILPENTDQIFNQCYPSENRRNEFSTRIPFTRH